MRQSVTEFVNKLKGYCPDYFKGKDILEMGSLNINGTIRDCFTDCNYIGIDIYDGPDVDVVSEFNAYKFDKQFDVVISADALEHDRLWKQSILKMYELVKPNGLLICTAGGIACREHGTTNCSPHNSPGTNNHYRNLDPQDVRSLLPTAIIEEDEKREGIYFYLVKK